MYILSMAILHYCDRWVSCAIYGKMGPLVAKLYVLAMLMHDYPWPTSEPYFPQIARLTHLLYIYKGNNKLNYFLKHQFTSKCPFQTLWCDIRHCARLILDGFQVRQQLFSDDRQGLNKVTHSARNYLPGSIRSNSSPFLLFPTKVSQYLVCLVYIAWAYIIE